MNFKEELKHIKAFAFDVDGVLSTNSIPLSPAGELQRCMNIKDGYALHWAAKIGIPIAIITGGNTEAVRIRFESLGINDIYMASHHKMDDFNDFLTKNDLKPEDVLYMGDDIPDYEVMQYAGLCACPADAAPEIKAIADYVSDKNGGCGCGRDIIEQTLKAQGRWMHTADAFGW
ncbi:MAG: HAD hydrolase family protein [Bacteroidales bacterium]|nr:HAD hydrolase family protein [Bacteroidales bacterium]MDY4512853.1 HAD hydrolase family protein [Paludibacteraceae bacterium]MDD6781398.1 HAD hydrolase family protein [Bacteroidales bacterium]MDD7528696.1 HAD hydrolase family protein [Bacteroidales bacterium]MDY4849833.1 HAD hydrolase family protein [Paludibacteraceae bacterium]